MRTSWQGLDLIKRFEGFSAMPYRCPAGYETVGYGHLVKEADRGNFPLSEEMAVAWLERDVEQAERAVRQFIEIPLRQAQFDALVSFTFNLGSGTLQRSALRRVVNRGDHVDVGAQFMRWVYAKGQVLPGLVRRRQAEAALYYS